MGPGREGAVSAAPSVVYAGALIRATDIWPYLAIAISAMTPVCVPGLGSCGVDRRWRCYYDPAKMLQWTPLHRAGVLRHEAEHLLREHHARIGSRDSWRWRRACDREINTPELAPYLPTGVLRPSQIHAAEGLLVEQYLRLGAGV